MKGKEIRRVVSPQAHRAVIENGCARTGELSPQRARRAAEMNLTTIVNMPTVLRPDPRSRLRNERRPHEKQTSHRL